ncbi:radical SAM protein [Christensenellaceae bacterium OttesenSCG-928-K19]|nr:radical SAM protein [Christensenellaceae bacterium OttesenSCG-928-K19]
MKPDVTFIEITNHCNFDCSFCPNHVLKRQKGFLDIAIARKFLSQLKKAGWDDVLVDLAVLGEPFMNKSVFDYLDLCKEYGLRVYLVTNGALIKPQIAKKIFKKYSKDDIEIEISFQTPTETTYQRRYNKQHTFFEYWQQIKDVICAKYKYKSDIRIILPITTYDFMLSVDDSVVCEKELDSLKLFENEETQKRWFYDYLNEMETFAQELIRKNCFKWRKIAKNTEEPWQHAEEFGVCMHTGKQNAYEVLTQNSSDKIIYYRLMPGIFTYFKKFGLWTRKVDYLERLLKEDKDIFVYTEPRHGEEKCDLVGNIGILSDGTIVPCCLDYEGEVSLGNIEDTDITSEQFQEKLEKFAENVLICETCRQCRSKVFILDTVSTDDERQEITAYGNNWNSVEVEEDGKKFRWTKESSDVYIYAKRDWKSIDLDMKVHPFLNGAMAFLTIEQYDIVANTFTMRKKQDLKLNVINNNRVTSVSCMLEKGSFYKICINTPIFEGGSDLRKLGLMVYGIYAH